jgi:hypothetical protein
MLSIGFGKVSIYSISKGLLNNLGNWSLWLIKWFGWKLRLGTIYWWNIIDFSKTKYFTGKDG